MKQYGKLFSFFAVIIITTSLVCSNDDADHVLLEGKSVITYQLNGGRFGDNLSSYCRAKWLSFKYDVPLLYQPFDHSDQLMLHERELQSSATLRALFKKKLIIPHHKRYTIDRDAGILYEHVWQSYVPVNWNDPAFLQEIKQCIAPRHLSQDIAMPQDRITVAVHVRTPGWFSADHGAGVRHHPLKYVTYNYYIQQIRCIADMFSDALLYVHIFTDHEQPQTLIKECKKKIKNDRIVYGYRQKGNSWRSYVVEDFFAMMKCDCLIRTKSMFSIYAERLGAHKVVIYPTHSVREGNLFKVKKVAIKICTEHGYKKQEFNVNYKGNV